MLLTKNIDWHNELNNNFDNWINHGRSILTASCKHHDESKENTNTEYSGYCEKCDIGETDCEPMMNYGYPLHHLPEDEDILKIVKETCLTIMENEEENQAYLVLCGGGMDLSQSIAYAYFLSGQGIPLELCHQVIKQGAFSISNEAYFKVMEEIKKTLMNENSISKRQIEEIEDYVKKHKAKLKKEKTPKTN